MKEQITGRQAMCIMAMFITGSSLIVGPSNEAERDSWLGILIGMAFALPVLFIYARMKKLQPDMNLYDIFIWIFGKVIGKILVALYTWYAFFLGGLVTRNFSEFVGVEAFVETPRFVMVLFIGLIAIYAVKSGLETVGRWSTIFLVVLAAVTILVTLFGIPLYKIENLTPIAENGIGPLLEGGYSIFAYPFAETIIFSLALCTLKPKANVYKVYYGALGIAAALLVTGTLRDEMILGMPLYMKLYHPSYISTSVISLGDFFFRFEIVVGVAFLLCGLVKILVLMMATSKGMAKLFDIQDHKKIIAPVGLLIILLSIIIYGSTMENVGWFTYFRYYTIPFQVIIPPIIWIIAEIKTRREKKIQTPPKPAPARPEGKGPAY